MVRTETDIIAQLLQDLPDIVLVLSATGELMWANRRAEELFGQSLAESIGISALEYVHPDDLELVLRSFETVQEKQIGNPLEIRVRLRDQWRLIELIGAPVTWYEEGAIVFCLRDLTDRRRFEVSRDDVARFRSLVHNASTIVMLISPEGSRESASGAMTRNLGHDPEDVESAPLVDIVHEEDREILQAALASALQDSSAHCPVVQGVRLLRRGGVESIAYELAFVNLLDDPTVRGLVVTAHDISARVATEHELHQALEGLRNTSSLLNATIESTADGLLVVDITRRVASFNKKFAEIWHLPESMLQGRDDTAIIDFAVAQVKDPEAFLTQIDELYAQSEIESTDTIEFKDGRVFERFSKPQYVDGVVVGRVWSFSDITDQKRLEHDLAHLAFHDTLTGLPNRNLFRDRLNHAIARSERSDALVAVLFLDLDNFKTVNDSLGHSAGDELLEHVARVLTACLRRSDTAARLGGDEFAVLVEDVKSRDEVFNLAKRIMTKMRQPLSVGGQTIVTTVSIGVTFGTAGSSSEQLLRNADLAMYLAKSQGKDRFDEFQDQMHTLVVERLELEADLRGAVDSSQFIVHYQPIVELDGRKIVGFEALVRWNHPSKGLLQPTEFIPFAEEVGIINEIDRLVLGEACTQAKSWQEQGLVGEDSLISVNLSALEIGSPDIIGIVADSLASTGFDPRCLVLEVTESALMRNIEIAVSNLYALAALGPRIAIDDFGTGYSSFSHLERLPIDILKIDQTFVTNSNKRNSLANLDLAIIQLAETLGLVAIAEGIEDADQAARLAQLGCRLAQGFYLGEPLDSNETEAMLQSLAPLNAGQRS